MGLLDLFVEKNDEAVPAEEPRAAQPLRVRPAAAMMPPATTPAQHQRQTAAVDGLMARVLARDTTYSRLARAMAALAEDVPDEKRRLKAALRTLGAAPANVLKTMTVHEAQLQTERQAFERELKARDAAEQERQNRRAAIGQELQELEEKKTALANEQHALMDKSLAETGVTKRAQDEFNAVADAVAATMAAHAAQLKE